MVKVGELFEAQVRDLASDGRGIVPHSSGAVVFVPGVWTGELCLVRITGKKGRAFVGELAELRQAHTKRRQAPCRYHGFSCHGLSYHGLSSAHCGGCPWQFMDYTSQLEAKQARVKKQFDKHGGDNTIKPIWGSPQEMGYRNRVQFKTDGTILGFVAEGTHILTAIESCPVLSEKNRIELSNLLSTLPNPKWVPHKKEKWTTLNLNETTEAKDVLINKRLPFQQGNSLQNQRMRNWLHEKITKIDANNILELFCGSGNFTEVIAAENRHILAVESSAHAIEELKQKNLPGVKTFVANLFDKQAFENIFNIQRDFDTIVLDPPRDGLKNKQGLLTKKSKIKNIIYISCDLATLARDLAYFTENAFKVKSIQPLDQFPQTPHIECMVFLSRYSGSDIKNRSCGI